MPRPRVLILRAPGTNCDVETAFAFEQAGGEPQTLHINRLLENRRRFADFQILCLPGGFSYGDDLAAGRILGSQIRCHLAEPLEEFKQAGKLILGICNGFQVLLKSGVLLADEPIEGATTAAPPATLAWNASGRFIDRWVRLRTSGNRCVFFADIESMYLPIAHAEGRFVPRAARVLSELERAGQLALKYEADDNPNGSTADVAAVCDPSGRVCGLMPHPERHIDPTQHPRWTRGEGGSEGDGLRVFRNAVRYFA
jgi:phosphoribosylformylglycinamidine synthase subunit PurQ / glutaminase